MYPEREIVELTKNLIRIPSTHSRPQEINRCAAFIESWLSERKIAYQRTDVKGTPSILVLPRDNTAKILFMAHFDVVEAENDTLFEPVERDGSLYGRGAIDDKYAVALCMVLFHQHLERLRREGGDQGDMCFGLLLTGDEEVGGSQGAAPALKQIETEYFIALDGGDPQQIITKEKGILQLKLTARGKTAHGARPWLGQNAFDLLVNDYREIQKLFTHETADHWHKTLVLSNCLAGDGSNNKVPGKATAILDIRYTENDDADAIEDAIRAAATSEVKVLAKEPLFMGGESPYLGLLLSCAGGAQVGFEHGASDARFLSVRGIPGVIWGADGEVSQHAIDEHLVITSLEPIYTGIEEFLTAVSDGVNPQ